MPNWKKLIVSGSDAALNSLNVTSALTASGLIYPTTDGDNGDFLTTDGIGNLSFGRPNVYSNVKNVSGGQLLKGTPVHATGTAGNTSEVIAASASVASTMPATFVLNETLANNAEGLALVTGYINGIDTSDFDEGDVVYVGATGSYTNIKPQGSNNLIQNIGLVNKVDASNGSGYIYGAGRSNDVPNLPEGKIWVGSSNYTVTSSVAHLDESNGRLGIGTDSPGHKLVVIGGNIQTDGIVYTNTIRDNSGGDVVIQDNAGNVGIGTTSPLDTLHVEGGDIRIRGASSTSDLILDHNNTYSGSRIRGIRDTGPDTQDFGSSALQFLTNDNSTTSAEVQMTLSSEGKLQIGSGFAPERLTVAGNISGSGCIQIGTGHTNSGTLSSIVGGTLNIISGTCSFIGGGSTNCVSGNLSFVGGGTQNDALANCTVVVGGCNNSISGLFSSIVGGRDNCISAAAWYGLIGGGRSNAICGNYGFIGGGCSNTICSLEQYSVIGGGQLNILDGDNSGILGGNSNCLIHDNSFIVGSNLTSSAACTTFMNNLDVEGTVSASIFSGSFVGDGSGLTGVGGNPGGSDTQVQYNNGGSFAGSSNLTFDGTNLTVGGNITSSGNIALSGNIVDTNTNESIHIGANDVWFEGKHTHACFGVWARSTSNGQRTMGIDGGSTFMALYTNSTEKVRIDTDGNVGIGTTSPTQKLDVRGNILISGSSNALFIKGNGSKQAKFSHDGSGLTIEPQTQNQDLSLGSTSCRFPSGIKHYGGDHIFYTGSASGEAVRIDKDTGYLGIGTNNPSEALSVEGNTCTSGLTTTNTLTVTGLSNQGSEATALMINGSNVVGTRELGSNAFSSTTFVDTSGTPADNQVAIFTDADTIEGSSNLTFDGTNLTVGGKVTATEIVTNIVSQSISFATGSNRFGDEITDTHTFTGSLLLSGSTSLTGDLFLGDNRKVVLGSGTDMLLYHNGTDSVIDNNTGDLYITNKADNKDIIFRSDDGSAGFTPYFRLDGSNERLIVEAPNGMLFYDNKKAKFGNGSDLEIYHTGAHSFITAQSGTGSLYIRPGNGNTVQIEDKSGTDMITAGGGGAVGLYYAGFKKLDTSNTGVTITGNISASGDLTLTDANPSIILTDTNSNSDFSINVNGGVFNIKDDTNSLARISLKSNGNVGIGTTSPDEALTVEGNISGSGDINILGTLTAAVKSFDIPHPTKDNKRLVYGVLEGPEHAVYVRGESKADTVILPEEWVGLVDETSITAQFTPIGKPDIYYYEGYENNIVKVGGPEEKNYFYYIQATRKDVEPLITVQ